MSVMTDALKKELGLEHVRGENLDSVMKRKINLLSASISAAAREMISDIELLGGKLQPMNFDYSNSVASELTFQIFKEAVHGVHNYLGGHLYTTSDNLTSTNIRYINGHHFPINIDVII